MSVIDESGVSRSLLSLWDKRKLVLVFTRHMGCRFCKEQVAELNKIQPVLAKHGLSVGVVTVGKYEDIPKFKRENNFSGEVYVDSSLQSPECYKIMKLANGMKYLFDSDDSKTEKQFLPETQEAAKRALEKGFQDGGYGTPDSEFTGDVLQIGGAFVLGPGNSCDYSYRCGYVGDLVDLGKVITAATGRDAEGEEVFYSRTLEWNDKLNNNEVAKDVDVPTSPVRMPNTSQSQKMRGKNAELLVYYTAAGLTGFILCGVSIVQLSRYGIMAEGNVQFAVTVAAIGVGLYCALGVFKNARNSHNLLPDTQPVSRRNSNVGCPITSKLDNSSVAEHFVGGRPLLRLSEVDKGVMRSPANLNCDCSFLEEVDMINMTDRYTMSAAVGVNADIFAKIHAVSTETSKLFTHSEDRNSDQDSSAGHESLSTGERVSYPGADQVVVSDPMFIGEELAAAQSTLCYVREFLAKPNPNLGRKGPTCPFVPKSLQLDSIYMSVLGKDVVSTSEELESLLLDAMQTFKQLEPSSGPKASYKAIILIFPDMEPSEVPALIDGTQKRLKPVFVEEGLMLGEFHLRNNATGLHNDHFYPLRTPYPCLAIRHMVPSDIVFLNPKEFPAEVRARMISTYVNKFGDKSAHDQQTEVARALLRELSENPGTKT